MESKKVWRKTLLTLCFFLLLFPSLLKADINLWVADTNAYDITLAWSTTYPSEYNEYIEWWVYQGGIFFGILSGEARRCGIGSLTPSAWYQYWVERHSTPLGEFRETSNRVLVQTLPSSGPGPGPGPGPSDTTWVLASGWASGWSARAGHTSVVFDNKIWVMGGTDGSNYKNDVWYSADGNNWTQATAHAAWGTRYGHTSVVFNDKMWVIGGCGGSNDVWYSTNGINWSRATAHAGWNAREGHASVVYDGKMWVIGGNGITEGGFLNDVWYSSDGINWIQATANAAWSAREGHTLVVLYNRMWLIGGNGRSNPEEWDSGYRSDVWYSSDGISWNEATNGSNWSIRSEHTSIVFNNKIWVIGGESLRWGEMSSNKNDVWFSSYGINWTQTIEHARWSARYGHTSVVFDNRIWVMGGYDSSGCKNDVWYYPRNTGIETENKIILKHLSLQNFPNPFNTSTTISYEIPISGLVQLRIYNLQGQLIKTLVDEEQKPGNYNIIWGGTDINGQTIPSGLYFYEITTESESQTKKMMLLK